MEDTNREKVILTVVLTFAEGIVGVSFSEYDAILKDLNSDLYGILASALLKHGKISYIKEFIECID